MSKKLKIAIIGYGRFGQLLARILSPYADIFIVSSRKIKGVKQIDYEDLGEVDMVIPCVPISKFEEIIKTINPFLKKNAIVMDVCSVKIFPVKIMKKYLRPDIQILATHPMFGPDSAKNGLTGLQMVVCPIRINEAQLKSILNIFKKLNLKLIQTTPEQHDKEAAQCLALVHFIGRGLAAINIKKENITTLGFDRLLAVNETVNNDTWELFLDMHHYNPYTKKIRQNFIDELKKLNKILEKGGKNG
jgi:prephenate dehydrogenase